MIGLNTLVRHFRPCAKRAVEIYRPSILWPSTVYALGHQVGDILVVRVHLINSSPYEQSRKTFKNCCIRTTKRTHSAMKETLNVIQERREVTKFQLQAKTRNHRKTHPQQSSAISIDTGWCVKHGAETNLNKIRKTIRDRYVMKESSSYATVFSLIDEMTSDLSDDALKGLAKFYQKQFYSCNLS